MGTGLGNQQRWVGGEVEGAGWGREQDDPSSYCNSPGESDGGSYGIVVDGSGPNPAMVASLSPQRLGELGRGV